MLYYVKLKCYRMWSYLRDFRLIMFPYIFFVLYFIIYTSYLLTVLITSFFCSCSYLDNQRNILHDIFSSSDFHVFLDIIIRSNISIFSWWYRHAITIVMTYLMECLMPSSYKSNHCFLFFQFSSSICLTLHICFGFIAVIWCSLCKASKC